MANKHLWEVKHDYYCSEGDYQESYGSWQAFIGDGWNDVDKDYNLLFRWDWDDEDELHLFFVLQRKGYISSITVHVTKDDETNVANYLRPFLAHMLNLWQPFAALASAAADTNEEAER